jgi:hypothetical protein
MNKSVQENELEVGVPTQRADMCIGSVDFRPILGRTRFDMFSQPGVQSPKRAKMRDYM